MALSETEKEIRKIVNRTTKDMKELHIYKPQFKTTIRRYAELIHLYNIQLQQFYETGCAIVEDYTNKAGATNERKTPLFMSLEKLRADILSLENVLGLNPSSYHKLTKSVIEPTKPEPTGLEKVLMNSDLD